MVATRFKKTKPMARVLHEKLNKRPHIAYRKIRYPIVPSGHPPYTRTHSTGTRLCSGNPV